MAREGRPAETVVADPDAVDESKIAQETRDETNQPIAGRSIEDFAKDYPGEGGDEGDGPDDEGEGKPADAGTERRGDAGKPAEVKPDEAAADPVADTLVSLGLRAEGQKGAVTAEEAQALQSFAQFGRSLETGLTSDPVKTLLGDGTKAGLLDFLDRAVPGAKAQIVAALTGSASPAGGQVQQAEGDFDAANYQPASDLEAHLLKQLPALAQVRDIPARIEQATKGLSETDDYIYINQVALDHKLNAVLQILGAELPNFDAGEVFRGMRPGVKVEDLVKSTFGKKLTDAVTIEKQKRAERPDTVRNGSGAKKQMPRAGASIMDWVNAYDDFHDQ